VVFEGPVGLLVHDDGFVQLVGSEQVIGKLTGRRDCRAGCPLNISMSTRVMVESICHSPALLCILSSVLW